ncbi:hypothetical protein LCGC14_2531120, partial [marine sediment metagenome]
MSERVLVADDSGVIRAIITDCLKDVGVSDVVEAADGSQAMALVEQEDFALVIIDWVMPVCNGLDVIKAIRAKGSQVPIIMVTAAG